MKIGVISDTHLHDYSINLERINDIYFKDVDMILHAGDIVSLNVLDGFLPKTIKAVAGNMDPPSVKNQLPVKRVIKINEFKIGLIHGWGSSEGIEGRIRQEFTEIDCLVYGHTHTPANHIMNGTLFFNPGSPTDSLFTKEKTVGLLEINDTVTGTIISI